MTLKKNIKSAEKSFRRNLMAIALPVALQNLMLALVGASDALMLGRLSQMPFQPFPLPIRFPLL